MSGPGTGGAGGQIDLNPIFDVNGLGFDIFPTLGNPFTAGATGVNDIQLNFVATVVGGANVIDDLFLSMTGSAGAASPGGSPGTDILSEQYCRGGFVPPGSCPSNGGSPLTDTLTITGPASGSTVQDTKTFALTNSLSILKDVQLNGVNGCASVTDVKNQISIVTAVPEPTTALFLGSGLIALGMVKRRYHRKQR